MKKCSKCGKEQSLENFFKRSYGGLNSWCKSCVNQGVRAYRAAHPQQVRARRQKYYRKNIDTSRQSSRRSFLKIKYGITPEEYDHMLLKQKHRCAICDGPPNGHGNRFNIDHDHKTGKVRALLCHSCNASLGHFKHSPSLLRKAALYLELHALPKSS